MELINQSNNSLSTGLHTAWLLATLGSKPSIRSKLIKKSTINYLLIPELCHELLASTNSTINDAQDKDAIIYEPPTPGNNIRYVSNIMHGISILYQTKINYLMNDLIYIESRLKCHYQNSYNDIVDLSSGSLIKTCLAPSIAKKRAIQYLNDDPAFSIQLGLVAPFTEETDEIAKRRKLDILQKDNDDFPLVNGNGGGLVDQLNFHSMTFTLHPQLDNPFEAEDHSSLNNGNNIGLSTDNEVIPDFEFDNNGDIVGIAGENLLLDSRSPTRELIHNEQADALNVTFDGNDVYELNPIPLNQTTSISNDLNFYTTTDTPLPNSTQRPIPQQTLGMEKLPFRKLLIDNHTRIDSDSMIHFVMNYESRMNTVMEPVKSVDEIVNNIYGVVDAVPPFTRFVNKVTLPNTNNNNHNNSVEQSFFTRTASILQKTEETGNENTEEGRNNMNIRNYAMEPEISDPNMYFEDGSHFELPRESEHIFNLEFDYNDINDVGEDDSIDGANSKNGSQQNSMSFDGSGDNLMTMDSKLNKFYRYIKARSNEFGKLVVGTYLISQAINENNVVLAEHTGDYYQTKFQILVPDSTHALDIEEPPVPRRVAANAFACVLTLATKSLINIEVIQETDELQNNNDINIILPLE